MLKISSVSHKDPTNTSKIFLVNESLKIVHVDTQDLKRYRIERDAGLWLIAAEKVAEVFSFFTFYEFEKINEDGTCTYKRSNLPPMMINKENFFQSVKKYLGGFGSPPKN